MDRLQCAFQQYRFAFSRNLPFKDEIRLFNIQALSPYRAVNTLHLSFTKPVF